MSTTAAILALLGSLLTIAVGIIGQHRMDNVEQRTAVALAVEQLKEAMRRGNVTDIAAAREQLDMARRGDLI